MKSLNIHMGNKKCWKKGFARRWHMKKCDGHRKSQNKFVFYCSRLSSAPTPRHNPVEKCLPYLQSNLYRQQNSLSHSSVSRDNFSCFMDFDGAQKSSSEWKVWMSSSFMGASGMFTTYLTVTIDDARLNWVRILILECDNNDTFNDTNVFATDFLNVH